MNKPICDKCNKNSCTVNYHRHGKIYYRKQCRKCILEKKKEKNLANQLLIKSGYVKKKICDRCNFHSKHPSQMKIYYLDGDKLNVSRNNLRTFCLNCLAEINILPSRKKSDLVPDY